MCNIFILFYSIFFHFPLILREDEREKKRHFFIAQNCYKKCIQLEYIGAREAFNLIKLNLIQQCFRKLRTPSESSNIFVKWQNQLTRVCYLISINFIWTNKKIILHNWKFFFCNKNISFETIYRVNIKVCFQTIYRQLRYFVSCTTHSPIFRPPASIHKFKLYNFELI